MKKFLTAAASIVIAAAMCAGFSACTTTDEPAVKASSVTLKAMSKATEVSDTEIDYYILPEPAATTMTTKNADLYNVGSLQTLYGGEDGYPQAVVVAKKSLIESDGAFVKEFIAAYKQTASWLSSLQDYSVIVNSINANYGESQSSLVVGQLNSTVIANCNISYTSATDDKSNIINYMNDVNEVDSTMYGECGDAFFQSESELNSLSSETETITIAMPDGAPAISMAYMMSGEVTFSKTVSYSVLDTSSSAAPLLQSTADIKVMPLNAAAKKYGSGSDYVLLGTVTHGNLFILSRNETALTSDNLDEQLNGKTVGVMQIANVPGLTAKMVLKKHNIDYTIAND